MKFSIKDFFSKCDPSPQFPADLVTFTEDILNGKLHFLCSVWINGNNTFRKIHWNSILEGRLKVERFFKKSFKIVATRLF